MTRERDALSRSKLGSQRCEAQSARPQSTDAWQHSHRAATTPSVMASMETCACAIWKQSKLATRRRAPRECSLATHSLARIDAPRRRRNGALSTCTASPRRRASTGHHWCRLATPRRSGATRRKTCWRAQEQSASQTSVASAIAHKCDADTSQHVTA